MKILLVANLAGGWPFIQELWDNLLKENIETDVFDSSTNELLTDNNKRIFFPRLSIGVFILKIPFVGRIIRQIQNKINQLILIKNINKIHQFYNIIEIHYVTPWHYSLLKKINKKNKIILVYWGSDLYVDKYYLKSPTHDLAEYLVFGRNSMAEDFLIISGNKYRDNIYYLNFGIGTIDYIKSIEKVESKSESRTKIGIPEDSFVITCGHNGRDLMQHEVIIGNIQKVKESLPENYILVIPFTYRFNEDYYIFIKSLLDEYNLRYKFILNFMSMEDVARLRIITDVHINVVTSDGLNASMLENMFAKAVVINGSWLHYDTLDEMGIFYIQADIDSLFLMLQSIFTNYSHYFKLSEKNKEIIDKYFTWEIAIKKRIDLYNKMVKE